MSKFRVLRTGSALAMPALRQYCPAIFSDVAAPDRGQRYQYIPTIKPLEALLEQGWGVFEASQVNANSMKKVPFVRHSLRLRRLDQIHLVSKYGRPLDGVAEVTLTNAHDGTAAYTLGAGYFRLVCSNGMTTGKSIATHRIIHSVGRATSEIIDVASRIIEDDIPRMIEQIASFQEAVLTDEQTYTLSKRAMALRYGGTPPPFPHEDLLKVRREVDAGNIAWNVLNRIQENVMQGGWETRSIFSGRKSRVRPVEAIVPTQKINAGLWTACEELIE